MTSKKTNRDCASGLTTYNFKLTGKSFLLYLLLSIPGLSIINTCSAQSNYSTSLAPANNPAYKNYTDSVNAVQQANIETHKISGTYRLTAVQLQQIQNINLQYYTQLNQIYSGVSTTTQVPQHKIDSINNVHNNALQAILNGIPQVQQNNQQLSK